MMPITNNNRQRYSRHLLLPEIGIEGQQRLSEARVLIVGAGGLGSPAALYLAAAGVGTIGIVDPDNVDLSNLQRQILFDESSLNTPKVEAAMHRLSRMNSDVQLIPHQFKLEGSNALELFAQYDTVLDASDNFATRYLVNDASILSKIPNVYGSIDRFSGQLTTFGLPDGPCYRCLFPNPPAAGSVASCAEAGVLGVLPGVIGILQATETLKFILGLGDLLRGRLVSYDSLSMRFNELRFSKDPSCPICSEHPSQRSLIDYDIFCGTPATDHLNSATDEIPVEEYRAIQKLLPHILLDVRTEAEYATHNIGGINIPLNSLEGNITIAPFEVDIIVVCQSGVRSVKAIEILRRKGYERVRSLAGGLKAYGLLEQ